jgi:hypothetical protein
VTDEQRKLFHAMVRDISKQVKWAGEFLDEEDWKRLILAGAYGQKVVPNPIRDGFIVMNNRRSSGLPITDTSDLITQLLVFGFDHQVVWTDPQYLDRSQPQSEIK